MQVLILGANPIGISLAEKLATEGHSVVLVDPDEKRLRDVREHLDIQTVTGHPSHPNVLENTNARDADMLLAVTDSDEINMVACQVASKIFATPSRICRVRSGTYLEHDELFVHYNRSEEILIHPEKLVTDAIVRVLQIPEALQVLEFAGGRVVMVATRVQDNSPIANCALREWLAQMPDGTEGRVAAMFRGGVPIVPEGSTSIRPGDEVFFIARRDHIPPLIHALHPTHQECRRVMIAGGGHIGGSLAAAIENTYRTRIIEPRTARCQELAEQLNKAIVVQGNVEDQKLLEQEEVRRTDVFCALTNDDATNIMASLLAKKLGAGRVIALISNPAFVELVQGDNIDIAISPQQFTISGILSHIRRGEVSRAHSLRYGTAEAVEFVIHGEKKSSRLVGSAVKDLPLPHGTTVGAIVRKGEPVSLHGTTLLESDDHVILFVTDNALMKKVETVFQAEFNAF